MFNLGRVSEPGRAGMTQQAASPVPPPTSGMRLKFPEEWDGGWEPTLSIHKGP